MEQRRAEEEATGKKKRGRKPKVVEPLPTEEAKANTTDPDSRIMKTRQGYVQGYNAQAVVSEEQIMVAVGVTQEANDVQQLEPMLQTMAHTLEAAGIEDRPKAGLADAGYWSEANIRACSWPEMPEPLIATTKDWNTAEDATGEGVSPRTYAKRTEPVGQDGAQAADEARSSSVQEAGCTGGAGVRTGQGRTGVPTVYATGVGRCTE